MSKIDILARHINTFEKISRKQVPGITLKFLAAFIKLECAKTIMAKYVFIYHGGKMPKSEEEGAKVMAEWQAWLMQTARHKMIDGLRREQIFANKSQ